MKFLKNNPALKQRRRDLRRSQTETEKTLWAHLRNRQFCGRRFFRQYSIGPYILDFYCPAEKLAIELDGGQHNEEEKKDYDLNRSEYLNIRGIDVVRFWNHEVLLDIEGVLIKLEGKITPPNLPFSKGEEEGGPKGGEE